MRINCFIFGLLLMCTPFGIAQEKEVTKIIFPYTTSIQSKSFSVPDVVFGKTPSLVVTNNYLIILRTYTEPLFHVFDLPDCKYIGGFGNLGKGPNDFELPDSRTGLKTSNGFKVFDHHKGFMYIDLSNYRENKIYGIKTLKVPGELYVLNDAIQLNNIIIGMPEDWKTKKQNVRYNIQTEKITYFGEYPNIFPERYRHIYWGAFWRHSVAKPDGTMYASFYDGVKMFRIYNSSGNIKIEKVIKVYNLFKGNSFSREPHKAYYKVVRANNQFIYTLCLDVLRNDYFKSFPNLEIWDWNGNPVASLTLDHHIKSFDITPDGKGIYAMDREVSDKLFYYDLEAAF